MLVKVIIYSSLNGSYYLFDVRIVTFDDIYTRLSSTRRKGQFFGEYLFD